MKLKDLVQKIGAQIVNPKGLTEDVEITGVAPLHNAGPQDLSFLTNPRFRDQLATSRAAAIIVREPHDDCLAIQLVHVNPQEAMALASLGFFSYQHRFAGQSPLASVHERAQVAASATIYPFAFIDAEASIQEHCVIYPHVYIGPKAKIGANCILFPGVVVMSEVEIGDNVIVHSNAVIGADGFGFASGKKGITKIPQTGKVVIDSDVEIGSLTNIDRATFDQTHIGRSTKIDSLVHIGHNVEIGEYSILCGQFGVAGSTKIGKRFLAGGQSAVTAGVTLGDGITIGGRCGVSRSLPDGGTYHGVPERPAQEWRRDVVLQKKLPELFKRMKMLEEKVAALKAQESGMESQSEL